MKLGTIKDGSRDGILAVVSRDGKRYEKVGDECLTMQTLLDSWDTLASVVDRKFQALESGEIAGESVDESLLAHLFRVHTSGLTVQHTSTISFLLEKQETQSRQQH